MDPKIKSQWVKALRSGRYVQGQGRLKNHKDEMCCLGVLCDISGFGVWSFEGYESDGITTQYYPPQSVQAWAGLEEEDPYVTDRRLSTHNDTGSTFRQIANLIEIYL